MNEVELQKVETVTFQISQEDGAGMSLIWKDGSLYLSISTLVLTDGKEWYSIPFRELRDIAMGDEGCITLKIEGAEIKMKGKNAERLMALRHLLLPLIERRPDEKELMESLIKLMLIGINDRRIIAAILRRSVEKVKELIKEGEKRGYISGISITSKGKSLLSEEEKENMRRAGVKI